MKKTILAAAIPALMATSATQAVELYNEDGTTFSVGGYLDMRVESNRDRDSNDRELEAINNTSRINFGFAHDMGNGFTGRALLEYGLDNPQSDSNSSFNNRLGYMALDHEQYGSLSFGKQWSTYGTVAGVTDMFIAYGGSAVGYYDGIDGGHGVAGTGRANDALQYNINVSDVNISAQYQFNDESAGRESSYSGAISYDFNFGLNIGATYHQLNRTDEVRNEIRNLDGTQSGDSKLSAISATYDQGPIYAAFTYAEMKNHISFDEGYSVADKAIGHEAIIAYRFDGGISLYGGWNAQEDKSANSQAEWAEGILGAAYDWNDARIYSEYSYKDSDNIEGAREKDKRVTLGVRYYF